MNRAVRRYQTTQTESANGRRALIGHYERALELVTGAERALAAGSEGEAIERIGRARTVLVELARGLDHTTGGALAENLHRLYDFCHRHLGHAAATREARPVAEVAVLLEGLLDAWRQSFERLDPSNKPAQQQIPEERSL